jgi:hypothetical protein
VARLFQYKAQYLETYCAVWLFSLSFSLSLSPSLSIWMTHTNELLWTKSREKTFSAGWKRNWTDIFFQPVSNAVTAHVVHLRSRIGIVEAIFVFESSWPADETFELCLPMYVGIQDTSRFARER